VLERDPIGHAELVGAGPRGGEEHLADVDAHPAGAEAGRPPAQQLALARREVELALAFTQPADLAEQHQLLFGERIQDAVSRFRDFVVA
jgi:hypothetical protein